MKNGKKVSEKDSNNLIMIGNSLRERENKRHFTITSKTECQRTYYLDEETNTIYAEKVDNKKKNIKFVWYKL